MGLYDIICMIIIHRILIGHQHALLGVETPAVDLAAVRGRGELRQRRAGAERAPAPRAVSLP